MKYCTITGCREVIADSEIHCHLHRGEQTKALVLTAQQIQKQRNVNGEIQITRESGNAYTGDYQCQTLVYDTRTGRFDGTSAAYNLYRS